MSLNPLRLTPTLTVRFLAWQVESLKVDEGCVAIAYEHGDLRGWNAFFGPGEYSGPSFEKAGAKVNDLKPAFGEVFAAEVT